jgi:hypothetical protein
MDFSGTLHLKGNIGWNERFVRLSASEAGASVLQIWASQAAFDSGKQMQSEREVAGVRELSARRSSIISSPARGNDRFPFEVMLVGGKRPVVLASSEQVNTVAWVAKLHDVAKLHEIVSGGGGEDDEAERAWEDAKAWNESRRLARAQAQAEIEEAGRLSDFEESFGAAQLETCRAALAAADGDGDGVLNRDELCAALERLGIRGVPPAELRALVEATDTDEDGATDLVEFLGLFTRAFTRARQDDAARTIARAFRSTARRNGMRRVVDAVRRSMATMSAMLVRGFEVLKYPTAGKPALRVLWLQADGTLCLDKPREAHAAQEPCKRSIRLEEISSVVVGAEHAVFQGARAKKAELVDGKESSLVSVFGAPGAPSFHFACDSGAAAEVLATKFTHLKIKLAQCPDKWARRRMAVAYAVHGRLAVPAAAPVPPVPPAVAAPSSLLLASPPKSVRAAAAPVAPATPEPAPPATAELDSSSSEDEERRTRGRGGEGEASSGSML